MLARLLLTAIVPLIALGLPVAAASAAADTTAPVLVSYDFNPKSVDVTGGSQIVTVTAQITDDTAVETPYMSLDSDTTSQSLGFGQMTLVSGNTANGTWQRSITIPTNAAPGTWTVQLQPLRDTLGNSNSAWHYHPTKLTVTNAPQDSTAPVLVSYDFNPKSVDVTGGSQIVTVTAQITDDTAVETPYMSLDSDTTSQSLGFGQMTLVSGNTANGTWQRSITIPTNAAPGTWTVQLQPLRDTLGNSNSAWHYHPTKLTVTNAPQDSTAPVLVSYDFNPKSVDVTGGSQIVTVTAQITDDTAVETPYMSLDSDTTSQSLGFGQMTLVSGNTANGTWQRSITIPTNAAPGTWTVQLQPLRDTLGNSNSAWHYHPTKLTVTQGSASAPNPPTSVQALRGDKAATVSWSASIDNGSPVTGYTVTSSPGGKTCTTSGATNCTVTGLTNGTTYAFTVTATNAIGTSPASEPSNTVTPAGVPDKPLTPTATRGDGQATVSWTMTGGNGSPVTGYTVTSSPGGKTCTTSGATNCTVTGLTTGITYAFTVMATNAIGTSPASEPSNTVTPAGVPDKPATPTATRGDGQATVSWTMTGGNGSAITGYTVTSSPGAKTCTTSGATNCTVTGLTNGITYAFTVMATNAIGTSPASEPSNPVTPEGAPAPTATTPTPTPTVPVPTPTSPAATAPNRMNAPKVIVRGAKVIVKWKAAVANGSPITRYLIDISKGKDKTAAASARKTVFKRLKPGRYRIRVAARNAVGTSPLSVWVTVRIR